MKRLQVGQQIPAIWTRDVKNNIVDSHSFKTDFTLQVFLRHAGCPFCNLAIHRLTKEYRLLKKSGCEVIAFVQSTEDKIQRDIYDRHDDKPKYSIVSDKQQDFYRLFKVTSGTVAVIGYTAKHASHWLESVRDKGYKQTDFDGSSSIVPALFLVDKTGVIVEADYSANMYDDATFTKLYEYLNFKTLHR